MSRRAEVTAAWGVAAWGIAALIVAPLSAAGAFAPEFVAPGLSWSAGATATAVAVGDINADGWLDIVTANPTANTVAVAIGLPGGQYGTPITYAAGTHPLSVAIADLNGDRRGDVVVANQTDNTVSVLLGQPDGRLGARIDFPCGAAPNAVAIADLDLNGLLDVVVTDGAGQCASVLLGDGSGGLSPHAEYFTASGPTAVHVGDVDLDGVPDLVVPTASGVFTTYLGNGDGTFWWRVDSTPQSGAPGFFALFDLTGDGRPDIVTTTGTKSLEVLAGDGDGHFTPLQTFANITVGSSTGLATLDLDHDGALDVVVPGSGMAAFRASGGQLQSLGLLLVSGWVTGAVDALDADRDGWTDVAAAQGEGFALFRNQQNGTFGPQARIVTPGAPAQIVSADLNRDGVADIVAGPVSGAASIFLGTASGGFVQGPPMNPLYAFTPAGLALADFDRDGIPDITFVGRDIYGANDLEVLHGVGDGSFTPSYPTYRVVSYPTDVVSGDLNEDGKLDAVVTSRSTANILSVLLGSGDGRFSAVHTVPANLGSGTPTLADVTGDGHLDLLLTGDRRLIVVPGLGTGNFAPPVTYAVAGGPSALLARDLDGDGFTDIAVSGATDSLQIFYGTGGGSFSAAIVAHGESGTGALAAADIDGDGGLDLVESCTGLSAVTVVHGSAGRAWATRASYAVNGGISGLLLLDYTHDGAIDVIVGSTSEAAVALAMNTGSGSVTAAGGGDVTHAGDFTLHLMRRAEGVLIRLSGGGSRTARITICDVRGRIVRHVFSGAIAAGGRDIAWDGRDEGGSRVPSSVLWVVADAGRVRRAVKFIVTH